MAIEQWGFLSVLYLLWHVASVYNGHIWEPLTALILSVAAGNIQYTTDWIEYTRFMLRSKHFCAWLQCFLLPQRKQLFSLAWNKCFFIIENLKNIRDKASAIRVFGKRNGQKFRYFAKIANLQVWCVKIVGKITVVKRDKIMICAMIWVNFGLFKGHQIKSKSSLLHI